MLLRGSAESRAALGLFAPQPAGAGGARPRGQGGVRSAVPLQSGTALMRIQFHRRTDCRSPAWSRRQGGARLCALRHSAPRPVRPMSLLGDERDSPRGRIVLMKDMLEKGGSPTKEQVFHIDRCLSCLNCKTACPSSVNYQRLVDQARAHIQEHYRRPLADRLLRFAIAKVMTRPRPGAPGPAVARSARRSPGFCRAGWAPWRAWGGGTAARRPSRPQFPKPAQVKRASPSCPAACRVRWRPRSTKRWAGCWRGAASNWWRWKARAVAARLPHHMGRERRFTGMGQESDHRL